MNLLSATLGRIAPSFRTLAEWADIYTPGLLERQVCKKTLQNRQCHVRRIVEALGSKRIGAIKPHEISSLIARVGKQHPVAAKRTLIEIRSMLDEAVNNGWLTTNPAKAVRVPRVVVRRRRLSLSEWQRIYAHAKEHSPPWVHRMMLLALVTGQRRSDLVKMKLADVWAHENGREYLHIAQAKTGARVAIPLDLRLDSIGATVREAVEGCRAYAKIGDGHLLRKTTGQPPCVESMSWRFEEARESVLPDEEGDMSPPSLHECRSLAAREYKRQGVDTQALLGHAKASMTDLYHNDRGLDARQGVWKVVETQHQPETT